MPKRVNRPELERAKRGGAALVGGEFTPQRHDIVHADALGFLAGDNALLRVQQVQAARRDTLLGRRIVDNTHDRP